MPFQTAAFLNHLFSRGIEFKNDSPATDLIFILGRRFHPGGGFRARLNEKRSVSSDDLKSRGGFGARINSDVLVQTFRADGHRIEGGNLKRLVVVDVNYAADNILCVCAKPAVYNASVSNVANNDLTFIKAFLILCRWPSARVFAKQPQRLQLRSIKTQSAAPVLQYL